MKRSNMVRGRKGKRERERIGKIRKGQGEVKGIVKKGKRNGRGQGKRKREREKCEGKGNGKGRGRERSGKGQEEEKAKEKGRERKRIKGDKKEIADKMRYEREERIK